LAIALAVSAAPLLGQDGTSSIDWKEGRATGLDKKSRKTSDIFQDFDVLSGKKKKEAIMIYFYWPKPVQGFIDTSGEVKVEAKFKEAGTFADGLVPVRSKKKWGFADTTGKVVIEAKYADVRGFSEGLAPVRSGIKWGFIDKEGKAKIDFQFEAANSFSEELAAVKSGGKWGFVDKEGKEVIKPQFADAGSFCEGLAPVIVDKTGKMVIEAKYADAKSFSSGLAAVKDGRKWGFIEQAGKMAIRPKFEDANSFSEDAAPVKIDGMWRFIDKSGGPAFTGQYEVAGSFSEGLAFVRSHAKKPKKNELKQIKLCEDMENKLFKNTHFVQVTQDFICVKVNFREFDKSLKSKYRVKHAPYIAIFDCLGKKVYKIDNPGVAINDVLIDLTDVADKSNDKRTSDK
jgi:hypothetical protein